MRCVLALLGALACLLAPAASAQTVDPTFGDNGVAYVPFWEQRPVYTHPAALFLHEDGSATTFGRAILRFTAAGRLDTTWGNKGMRAIGTTGPVVRLPDQHFVAAESRAIRTWGWGEPIPDSIDADIVFTRFTPDGTRDSTFGQNGERLLNIPRPLTSTGEVARRRATNDNLLSLVAEPDGRIVGVGFSYVPFEIPYAAYEPVRGMALRLLPDGSPDASFGTGGVILLPDSMAGPLHHVARQPDGRYVAVMKMEDGVRVVRLLTDGQLDPAFGLRGSTRVGISRPVVHFAGVSVDAIGRITVGALTNTTKVFVRLLPDGTPDPAFGTNGVVQVSPMPPAGSVYMSTMAPSPDGSILGVGGDGRFSHLTLLRPDGSVQETVTSLTASTNEGLSAVAARPDGRWVVAGMGPQYEHTQFLHLAGDLRPVVSTVVAKQVTVAANGYPTSLAVRADGRTLLGVSLRSELLLFDVEGRVDTTIQSGGIWPFLPIGNTVLALDFAANLSGRVYSLLPSLYVQDHGPFPFYRLAGADPDAEGRYVLAGPIGLADGNNTTVDVGLMRIGQYARPDLSFGPEGVRRLDMQQAGLSGPNNTDIPRALIHGPDGSLYLAGLMSGTHGVVRFAPDGTLDLAFGTGGIWRSPVSLDYVVLTWHPTYGLLVTTFSGIQGVEGVDARVYALHASGQPNTAFATGGERPPVHIPFLPETLLPLHSGHVVAAGTRVGPVSGLFVLRPDGAPETNVGSAGLLEFTEPRFTEPLKDVLRLTAAQGPAGRSDADDRTVTFAGMVHHGAVVFRLVLPAVPTAGVDDLPLGLRFALQPPAPTPTREATAVRFSLDAAGPATLAVFDVLGREVLRLADGPHAAGSHTAALDAAALPPGRYLVRLSAGGRHLVQPLVRVR